MADSCESERQIARLMRRIERNCEAIQRLMDEPGFPAPSRAINKRIQAFALRDEQLALLVGPLKAYEMSFRVFRKAIGSERCTRTCSSGGRIVFTMTESHLEEYEAWLMNPERWRNLTPEERKRDVSWLLYYTWEGCKRTQEKLNDPILSAEEQEKYRRSLDTLKHREEKLREYADDEAFAKILNSDQ